MLPSAAVNGVTRRISVPYLINRIHYEQKLFVSVAIGGCLILGVPVILNLLWKTDLGDPNGWLSFWGAYLGGILTALIGFCALFQNQRIYSETTKRQNQDIIDKYQTIQAKELEQELVKRMSAFNMGPISRVLGKCEKGISKEESIRAFDDLSARLDRVEDLTTAWYFFSWPDDMTYKPKSFEVQYKEHVESYRDIIQGTLDVLSTSSRKPHKDKEKIDSLRSQITQFCTSIFSSLGRNTREWICKETPL